MPNKSVDSMINMRVTANSIQGHRKYMEDCYKIRFQRESSLMASKNKAMLHAAKSAGYLSAQSTTQPDASSQSDILFSYFAIFDGHGGKEASQYAKENLYWKIVELEDFWSDDDAKVLSAIREGFIKTHMEMWDELSKWPKTASGLPSTSGSTATILFIKKSKAYVGHVGDSGLVIGYTKNSHSATSLSSSNIPWLAKKLTKDHKPEDPTELKRIESSGGSVMTKGGVNRVVWNRPILNNTTKRNTLLNSTSMSHISHYNDYNQQQLPQTERIPFLAVARSLGDLWSYDSNRDEFIVSPVPDVFHFDIDPRFHKCLILATDGLWNVMRASECVEQVRLTDKETEELKNISPCDLTANAQPAQPFVNPSQRLNSVALQRCCEKMIRADNTTCITIMLDQPIDEEEDDDYLNSDETIIQAANITSLAPNNKTFDQTRNINDSEYYHENIVNDLKNDNKKDLEDDDEDELEDYELKRRRRQKDKSNKKAFNQTTSTTLDDNFNTPLSSDKRSRSLISLRRRHWSGTSNRSSSQNNITAMNTLNNRNKFVNSEYREQRKLFEDDNQSRINKSKNSQCVSNGRSSRSTGHRLANSSNYESVPNFNQGTRIKISRTTTRTTTTTLQVKQQQQSKKMLNTSSLSTFKSINKISKNLRKSFNDLYTSKPDKKRDISRKFNQTECENEYEEDLDDSKENNNSSNKESKNDSNQQKASPSKYSKRLKRFKNQIIKTKNSLFNKKRNLFTTKKRNDQFSEDCNISKSMPDLNRIELDDKSDVCADAKDEEINLKTNQSFVNNLKTKFNLKRNNRCIKNETSAAESNLTNLQCKRPKFY